MIDIKVTKTQRRVRPMHAGIHDRKKYLLPRLPLLVAGYAKR